MIHGAEATLRQAQWHGRAVVTKERVSKTYRHPVLDERIRNERTREESRLLLTARQAGVPVPIVYDIDRQRACITMEHIEGTPLRDLLPESSQTQAEAWLHELGQHVAQLHGAGLTHGDLTTSNVLIGTRMVLIDFGLGQASREAEPRGVDLHLVEEALQATDGRHEALFGAFMAGYEVDRNQADAKRRLEAIRERGRYRGHG